VAYTPNKDSYLLLPVFSRLIAPAREYYSAKKIMQDAIIYMELVFNGKGTYVFDRGFDDRMLINIKTTSALNSLLEILIQFIYIKLRQLLYCSPIYSQLPRYLRLTLGLG